MADDEDAPPPEDEAPPEEPAPEETAPEETTAPEPPSEAPQEPPSGNQDALTMEFLYYGSILKTLTNTLSNESDREHVAQWIRKLFRPEYQTTKLREKRNRYLVSLAISLMNDEVCGIFEERPPEEVLVDLSTLKFEQSDAAEWELDKMWHQTLLALPDDFPMNECLVHESKEACGNDILLARILDQEYMFLLYITRPFAALLPAEDKTRIAAWIQKLCTIHGQACCSMKGVRNDYMMALLGYLHDLRIVGPFVNYPPEKLETLKEAAKKAAENCPITDPTGYEANQFLLEQPIPDDGAFCYVALTGDLIASNLS